jgi:hypothetical protein
MSKYCVIPGRAPVRLDSLDGNIIIIGEKPRPIAEQFVSAAKAAGCVTEEELRSLTGKPAVAAPVIVEAAVVKEPLVIPEGFKKGAFGRLVPVDK